MGCSLSSVDHAQAKTRRKAVFQRVQKETIEVGLQKDDSEISTLGPKHYNIEEADVPRYSSNHHIDSSLSNQDFLARQKQQQGEITATLDLDGGEFTQEVVSQGLHELVAHADPPQPSRPLPALGLARRPPYLIPEVSCEDGESKASNFSPRKGVQPKHSDLNSDAPQVELRHKRSSFNPNKKQPTDFDSLSNKSVTLNSPTITHKGAFSPPQVSNFPIHNDSLLDIEDRSDKDLGLWNKLSPIRKVDEKYDVLDSSYSPPVDLAIKHKQPKNRFGLKLQPSDKKERKDMFGDFDSPRKGFLKTRSATMFESNTWVEGVDQQDVHHNKKVQNRLADAINKVYQKHLESKEPFLYPTRKLTRAASYSGLPSAHSRLNQHFKILLQNCKEKAMVRQNELLEKEERSRPCKESMDAKDHRNGVSQTGEVSPNSQVKSLAKKNVIPIKDSDSNSPGKHQNQPTSSVQSSTSKTKSLPKRTFRTIPHTPLISLNTMTHRTDHSPPSP